MLVDLALAPEHRRGRGALYGTLNQGRIGVARLRRARAGMTLSTAADGVVSLEPTTDAVASALMSGCRWWRPRSGGLSLRDPAVGAAGERGGIASPRVLRAPWRDGSTGVSL